MQLNGGIFASGGNAAGEGEAGRDMGTHLFADTVCK